MTKLDNQEKIKQITEKYAEIMQILGIPASPHSYETPSRVAKMLVNEFFRGLWDDPPKITTFPCTKPAGVVVEKDISFISMCAHHHLPFQGVVAIAYQPDYEVIGLSKLPRIVEYCAARPQIQEELTKEIAESIIKAIDPKWIAVKVKATHDCVCLRGIRNPTAFTETEYIRLLTTGYDKEIIRTYLH